MSDDGEWIEGAILDDWRARDEAKDARISALEDALAKADELAGAVDHERNMVCQDFGMQQKCAETVDSTLTAYRQARDATR